MTTSEVRRARQHKLGSIKVLQRKPGLSQGEWQLCPSGAPSRSTRGILWSLVPLFLLTSAPAHADEWWGPDKGLHFGFSLGLSLTGYGAASLWSDRPWSRALTGAALSLGLGGAKELWDATGHGDPSWKDMAWNGAGTAVGCGMGLTLDWTFQQ